MYKPWWLVVKALLLGVLLTVMVPAQADNEPTTTSAAMRKEIRLLEKKPATPSIPKSADAMESAIGLLEAQVKAMQVSLSDVMDRISQQQALPTVAREQVTSAQKQIQDLQDKLAAVTRGDQSLAANNLQTQIVKQQLANANLRREIAQSRLEGYQKLLELYSVNRDLLLLRMGGIKTALGLLRDERDTLRQEKVEKEQQAVARMQTEMAEKPKLEVEQLAENQHLTLALSTITDNLSHTNDALEDGKQELQDIRYRYDMAQQQLQLTDVHQYVGDYLLRQRQSLQLRIKDQQENSDLSEQISNARLDQFKYDDDLHQVRTTVAREQMADDMLAQVKGLDDEQKIKTRRSLLEILAQRESLLSKLVETNAKYVVSLTNLALLYQDQCRMVEIHSRQPDLVSHESRLASVAERLAADAGAADFAVGGRSGCDGRVAVASTAGDPPSGPGQGPYR